MDRTADLCVQMKLVYTTGPKPFLYAKYTTSTYDIPAKSRMLIADWQWFKWRSYILTHPSVVSSIGLSEVAHSASSTAMLVSFGPHFNCPSTVSYKYVYVSLHENCF